MITFIFSIFRSISGVSLTTKIVAIVVAGIGALQVNNMVQRSIGKKIGKVEANLETKGANENATQAGQQAANKSGGPAPRRRDPKRLPGYRD